MKRGVVLLTAEALAESLRLASDHRVTMVEWSWRNRNIEVQIEGPSMPETPEGCIPLTVELSDAQ